MSDAPDPDASGRDPSTEVVATSCFVRRRNALLLRADFGPMYTDYYLHLMQHGLRLEPAHDALLKETLAALALHLIARPRDEAVAWTINLHEPTINLFATGDSRSGQIVGRVFTEHVKAGDKNLFYAQTVRPNHPAQTSVIHVEGSEPLILAEQFYRQSQQLPARFFHLGESDAYALVAGMPDCDQPWIEDLRAEEVAGIEQTEELGFLEQRVYRFGCHCTLGRIVNAVGSLANASLDELFSDAAAIVVTCPRCGASYTATREALEASRSESAGN